MRMDGLADIDRVGAHFDGERNLADEIARSGSDDGAANQAVRLLGEDQLGEALVAAVGDGASRGCPGAFGDPEFDSLFFRFLLGCSRPGDLTIGVSHPGNPARVAVGFPPSSGFRSDVTFVYRL